MSREFPNFWINWSIKLNQFEAGPCRQFSTSHCFHGKAFTNTEVTLILQAVVISLCALPSQLNPSFIRLIILQSLLALLLDFPWDSGNANCSGQFVFDSKSLLCRQHGSSSEFTLPSCAPQAGFISFNSLNPLWSVLLNFPCATQAMQINLNSNWLSIWVTTVKVSSSSNCCRLKNALCLCWAGPPKLCSRLSAAPRAWPLNSLPTCLEELSGVIVSWRAFRSDNQWLQGLKSGLELATE